MMRAVFFSLLLALSAHGFTPTNIANYAFGLEADSLKSLADGANITTWSDPYSAHSATPVGTAPKKQTSVWGYPVARFSGSDHLQSDSFLDSSFNSAFTVVFVSTSTQRGLGQYAATCGNGSTFMVGGVMQGGGLVNNWWNSVILSTPLNKAAYPGYGQVNSFRYDGAHMTYCVGTNQWFNQACSGNMGLSGSLIIGADGLGANNLKGDLRAVYIYKRAISDSELASLVSYASDKSPSFSGTNINFLVGDSLYTDACSTGTSIPTLLETQMNSDGVTNNYIFVNAIGGTTLSNMLWRSTTSVDPYLSGPNTAYRNTVIIEGGLNDANAGWPESLIESNMTALAMHYKQMGCQVAVWTIGPCTSCSPALRITCTNVNTWIRTNTGAWDRVIDVMSDPRLADGSNPTYFCDGTHHTTAGKQVIASMIATNLENWPTPPIINPTNRIDWIVGQTVGVQRAIPNRTNLINVTQAPYNADNTGSSDAATAINSAITAAGSNDVVYIPTGRYKLLSQLTVDKSHITIRGDGPTNTVLMGLGSQSAVIVVGHDGISADPTRVYTNTVGVSKGSTNIYITKTTDGFGSTIAAGDMLILSEATRQLSPTTINPTFPVISVANYDRIIKQPVIISTVSGTNLTLTTPAAFDYTNSAQLQELSPAWFAGPRQMVGLESFGVTMTNNGSTGSAGFMVQASCVRDCWFTNLDLGFANNYQFDLVKAVSCTVSGCVIHDALSAGTSHSGILVANAAACLIENNIFFSDPSRTYTDGSGTHLLNLFPAIEFNDGVMGNAFFGNYFTNNAQDVDCHNAHPAMNLWEQNVFGNSIQMDGYFGSASHQTVFRNVMPSTMPMKRFTSFMQVLGNVMGSTNYSYVYYREDSGYNSAPWGIFEFGFPNIGNSSYTGTNPPIAWNYPGKSLIPFIEPFNPITNGVFTFTGNYGPTNVLWTNMGTGTFTNIPAPISAGYALVFQDPNNTNVYWGDTNGTVLTSVGAGTASNLTLSGWVYVTNGSTLYIAGQNAYQQLQSSNKWTHNLHGNLVYTNTPGTMVWDATDGNRLLPQSYLYSSSQPSWWGTNRWPAIDPIDAVPVAKIPAQVRYETGFLPGGIVAALTTIGSGSTISSGNGSKLYFGQ